MHDCKLFLSTTRVEKVEAMGRVRAEWITEAVRRLTTEIGTNNAMER